MHSDPCFADVASGPAMYLVREGLAATPVGSWIEAEQERAVGAVSNRFEERPGYSRADAGNAAVGTISVGGMTFFGAAGLLKRLPMIERLLAKLPRAKFSDDRNVQMAGTGSLPAANKLGEAHNAASFAKYKEMLLVSEKASPLVDSITATGRLPGNFVTKQQAINAGWRPGRALNNYVPGGQIGGGVFHNTTGILLSAPGRVSYEADVGLNGAMSRANQPGTRLLYSSDGQMYITSDHYNTVHPFGGPQE